MTDARYEDGTDSPLRLIARDGDDLTVISALVQDAVVAVSDLAFDRRRRRFVLLVNRFRWEDRTAAEHARRPYERVRSVLVIEDVLSVKRQGLDPRDRDTVLSLLSIGFAPGADGSGRVTLTLAGDGALALEVEALEVRLEDVTRPHLAASGRMPEHGE